MAKVIFKGGSSNSDGSNGGIGETVYGFITVIICIFLFKEMGFIGIIVGLFWPIVVLVFLIKLIIE